MSESIKKEEDSYVLQYYVVMNHEEQYSIWPTYKPIPRGWKSVGEAGAKEECLNYIDKVWSDMRPLSLRVKMEEMERKAKKMGEENIYDGEIVEEKTQREYKYVL